MRKYRVLWLLMLVFLATGFSDAPGNDRPWVLVDTKRQIITVRQDGRVLERFEDISLGRGGVTHQRYAGDGKTPLGSFRIAWIKRDSPFHLFFGFDYPNIGYARWAYAQGWIDEPTFRSIQRAIRQNKPPPQRTALGGYIGIHGLGNGDPEIHRSFNWTQGCIAVTNEQIERLEKWMKIGTRVIVR